MASYALLPDDVAYSFSLPVIFCEDVKEASMKFASSH